MKVVTVGTSKNVADNIEQMRLAGVEVFACISRDLNRAKEFADNNKVERYSNNYDNALKSSEFDFVYLGIPNIFHYEYARLALEKGKDVIVEKPMCINQKQARELISLAISKHLYIFENMKTYHSLAYKTLMQDVEKIKPIRMVNLSLSEMSSHYEALKGNKPRTKLSLEYGSGALMDLNCYNISFAIGLFGLPLSCLYIPTKINDVDTSGTAVLKYKDYIVNCIAGKDSYAQNYVDICGEKGHIYSSRPTSLFDSYQTITSSGNNRDTNLNEPYPFVPVYKCFKDIYENNNTYKYDYLMKLSLMELKVLDELRKTANIKYKGEY